MLRQQGRAAQQGTSGTVLGADTAAQEWQVAYEGDVSIRCAAVAENGLYVAVSLRTDRREWNICLTAAERPETFF